MKTGSSHIGSPLRDYVARLLMRDQAKTHKDRKAARYEADVRPGLEPLETRLLLTASMGPIASSITDTSPVNDLPVVNVSNSVTQHEGIASVKWRGQQVDAVEYEWIVKFSDDAQQSESKLDALAASLSPYTEVRNLTADGYGVLVAPHANLMGWQLNRWATSQANVESISPNTIYYFDSITNDTDIDKLWGLNNEGQAGEFGGINNIYSEGLEGAGYFDADINAPEAWGVTGGANQNVVIAVIDSGIDYTHPDLASNMWTNPGEIPGDGIDNDGNGFIDDVYGYDFCDYNDSDPMDDYFHGTHIAGTIAAEANNNLGVAGVAGTGNNVKLMAIKVGSEGHLDHSALIEAYDYITMMKRDFGINIVASNNSYGSSLLVENNILAIEAHRDQGIIFVASAGNTGIDNDTFSYYPTNYDIDNIISVAATDRRDQLAYFSSFGPGSVDVGAPGYQIYSTMPTTRTDAMISGGYDPDGTGYEYLYGTSMAAPHVAGLVGLIASYDPTLTYSQIKSTILSSVTPLAELIDTTITGGRINAQAALESVKYSGPAVRSVSPGRQGIMSDTVSIWFTDNIDPTTVVPASFDLRTGGGSIITLGNIDISADHIQIMLGTELEADTYQLTIAGTGVNAIKNVGGQAIYDGADYIYDFEIVPAVGLFESNEWIDEAKDTELYGVGSDSFRAEIGDGYHSAFDVDMYSFSISSPMLLTALIDTQTTLSGLDSILRLFDDTGTELRINDDTNLLDSKLEVSLTTPGTYYLGVSGFGNDGYDATERASGSAASSQGEYDIDITLAALTTPTNAIRGTKWHDLNNDGSRGDGDDGLVGWTIYLDLNTNGVFDGTDIPVVTDANGEYEFIDLPVQSPYTTYTVVEQLEDGWGSTAESHVVNLGPTDFVTGMDFSDRVAGSTIVVTSDVDDLDNQYVFGKLGVREALQIAAKYAGVNQIEFHAGLTGSTIVLNKGQLDIDSSVSLVGLGSDLITIDANGQGRVIDVQYLDVDPDATPGSRVEATISGVKLTGGNVEGALGLLLIGENSGGGIRNAGILTVTDSVITENEVRESGGGIYNAFTGSLSITNTTVSANHAQSLLGDGHIPGATSVERLGGGGGIANIGEMSLIDSSKIIDNTTIEMGGGIFNMRSSVTLDIVDTEISGNSATGHTRGLNFGGGIFHNDRYVVDDSYASLKISNSLLSNNVANASGGGLSTFTLFDSGSPNYTFGEVLIENTTISGNTAGISGGGASVDYLATIVNSTIVDNMTTIVDSRLAYGGGGIHTKTSGNVTLHNSIVANNYKNNGNTRNDVQVNTVSTTNNPALDALSSNNLIGADTSGTGRSGLTNGDMGNQIGTSYNPIDPLLGTLADNGGPTMTHALLAGSSAVNRGSDAQAAAAGLTTDQRGVAHLHTVDIGAYETTDYLVSTLIDEVDTDYSYGDLSLREAIELTEANPGADVIVFDPALNGGWIQLQLGELDITSGTVDIIGPGAEQMYIDGGGGRPCVRHLRRCNRLHQCLAHRRGRRDLRWQYQERG